MSKKVDKRAVIRNRIRRRLYELFRRHWPDLEVKLDLAITVLRPELATMEAGELQHLFLAQLTKVREATIKGEANH